jgi:hypothetical protein
MRTTITLDPDVRALLERTMRERRVTLRVALNDAIRAGLGRGRSTRRFRTQTQAMGLPRIDLTKAHAIAMGLEDEESARELMVGR